MQKLLVGHLTKHIHQLSLVGCLFVDVIFCSITNPDNGSSYVLVIGFILLAVSLYFIIDRLLLFMSLCGLTIGKYRHRLAICIAGVCMGLTALQSIGELTARDVMIFIPLSAILYVYFSYGRIKLRSNN
jgi:hypothetical protein